MYELLVLSLLMHFPLHAYLIAKIANDIIGPWEKISRGTLSTLLGKLEKEKYIAAVELASAPYPKDRPSRTFAITPSGRERFLKLMMDTSSNLGAYQKLFHIKALHLVFLPVEDQVYLINHYLKYCQKVIDHLQTESQDFAGDPEKRRYSSIQFNETVLDLMRLHIEEWQIEAAWAQRLHDKIVSGKK